MKKNGFSTIELLVSFVIISFIAIAMFKTVVDLLDKVNYYQNQSNTSILNGDIINSVQKDLKQRKLYAIDMCGAGCYDITYQDFSVRRLKTDSVANTIQYGGITDKLSKNVVIDGDLQITRKTLESPSGENDTILKIYIPIRNEMTDVTSDINIVHQYDSRDGAVRASLLLTPTYITIPSSGWATSKTVIIDYSNNDAIAQYSLNESGTWTTSTGQTQALIFTANGSVTARVSDGMSTVTADKYYVNQIDVTGPTSATATIGTITSNSIQVFASGADSESGIARYQFSKNNGSTWTSSQTSSSYTFTGLTTGTYTFKVRVINGAGSTRDSSAVSATTTSLPTPTYSISPLSGWAKSKTVTINYQTTGYTKKYSTNGGTSWSTTSLQNRTVTFNANGSVIAQITDGTNTITASSYTVSQVDTSSPSITNPSFSDWTNVASRSITPSISDTGSGISVKKYAYGQQSTSYFASSGTTFTTSFTATKYRYTVYAKDLAGNETISYGWSNIDTLPPDGCDLTYDDCDAGGCISSVSYDSNTAYVYVRKNTGGAVYPTIGIGVSCNDQPATDDSGSSWGLYFEKKVANMPWETFGDTPWDKNGQTNPKYHYVRVRDAAGNWSVGTENIVYTILVYWQ